MCSDYWQQVVVCQKVTNCCITVKQEKDNISEGLIMKDRKQLFSKHLSPSCSYWTKHESMYWMVLNTALRGSLYVHSVSRYSKLSSYLTTTCTLLTFSWRGTNKCQLDKQTVNKHTSIYTQNETSWVTQIRLFPGVPANHTGFPHQLTDDEWLSSIRNWSILLKPQYAKCL